MPVVTQRPPAPVALPCVAWQYDGDYLVVFVELRKQLPAICDVAAIARAVMELRNEPEPDVHAFCWEFADVQLEAGTDAVRYVVRLPWRFQRAPTTAVAQ